jgi:hypothetical protein
MAKLGQHVLRTFQVENEEVDPSKVKGYSLTAKEKVADHQPFDK